MNKSASPFFMGDASRKNRPPNHEKKERRNIVEEKYENEMEEWSTVYNGLRCSILFWVNIRGTSVG